MQYRDESEGEDMNTLLNEVWMERAPGEEKETPPIPQALSAGEGGGARTRRKTGKAMAHGLLDTLLGAPLDNLRSHLDCVLDACTPPTLLALSSCGWCLHLALAPSLKKAEEKGGGGGGRGMYSCHKHLGPVTHGNLQ